jgi:hypothetical protein
MYAPAFFPDSSFKGKNKEERALLTYPKKCGSNQYTKEEE